MVRCRAGQSRPAPQPLSTTITIGPLPGKPAPGERRAATYTDGTRESGSHSNDTATNTESAKQAAE